MQLSSTFFPQLQAHLHAIPPLQFQQQTPAPARASPSTAISPLFSPRAGVAPVSPYHAPSAGSPQPLLVRAEAETDLEEKYHQFDLNTQYPREAQRQSSSSSYPPQEFQSPPTPTQRGGRGRPPARGPGRKKRGMSSRALRSRSRSPPIRRGRGRGRARGRGKGGSTGGGGGGGSKKRGTLPKEAVDRLKTWLYAHFNRPYPTEAEKRELAEETKVQVNSLLK